MKLWRQLETQYRWGLSTAYRNTLQCDYVTSTIQTSHEEFFYLKRTWRSPIWKEKILFSKGVFAFTQVKFSAYVSYYVFDWLYDL